MSQTIGDADKSYEEETSNFALEKHLEDFILQNWESTIIGKDYDVYLDEDGEITFSPLENDEIDVGDDYYGLSITVSDTTDGYGTVTLNSDNTVTFVPNENIQSNIRN